MKEKILEIKKKIYDLQSSIDYPSNDLNIAYDRICLFEQYLLGE